MFSEESYKNIVKTFIDSTLPKSEWSHEAHLVMALHFVSRHLPENILPLVRKKIQKLNDFHGTPNTDDSGYHETLTVFWLNNAFSFYLKNGELELDELAHSFIQSEEGNATYPLNFYSENRLYSTEARKSFVGPNIKKFDFQNLLKVYFHGHLTDQDFLKSLDDCSLDPSLFNHEAHLRLAWLYINERGVESAELKVSDTIQKYVAHLGANDKYHHTLTIAAVKTVYHFYQKYQGENFFDFIDEFPRVANEFKSLIDAHYSPAHIFSSEAKSHYLEPDLLEYT